MYRFAKRLTKIKIMNKPKNQTMLYRIKSLNAGLIILCLTIIFCSSINAQDIITLKTGDVLTVKTFQITDTEIKYKELNNLEGPLYTLSKSDVFSIKYQNGTKTVFDNVPSNISNQSQKKTENPASKFEEDQSDFAKIKEKDFGGPRIGLTFIAPGTVATYLTNKNLRPLITQFGWQFEKRLFTTDDGTSGLVECIPMIGGIEQGLFLPNASFLMGIRNGGKRSFEFALGPNFSVVADYKGEANLSTGLVIAAGLNFVNGNINFPVNIAFVPAIGSKHDTYDANGNVVLDSSGNSIQKNYSTGWKLSLVVGFNLRKK
jgi:hypothetical protein